MTRDGPPVTEAEWRPGLFGGVGGGRGGVGSGTGSGGEWRGCFLSKDREEEAGGVL